MARMNELPADVVERDESWLQSEATAEGWRRIVLTLVAVFAVVGIGGLRTWQWTNDPRFHLLTQETDAHWIRADRPFWLEGTFTETKETHFLCEFPVSQPISTGIVRVRAYQAFRLWLDTADLQAAPLFDHTPTEGQSWNDPVDVWLPPLNPGRHRILISVTNRGGPPCLLVSSPDLGIFTGCHWLSAGDAVGFSTLVDSRSAFGSGRTVGTAWSVVAPGNQQHRSGFDTDRNGRVGLSRIRPVPDRTPPNSAGQ